ncbi:unnamed protein product, partial [marine sediment metagenome]
LYQTHASELHAIFTIDKKLPILYILSAFLKTTLLSGPDMMLEKLLLQKKTSILERWFNLILQSYP